MTALPTAPLPTNRTNATAQIDEHPADHNSLAGAVNALVERATGATVRAGYFIGTTSAGGEITVTFAAFSATPVVIGQNADAVKGAFTVALVQASTTQATFRLRYTDGQNTGVTNVPVSVAWVAVGPS